MKQQETIKPMVKSVIKTYFFLGFFFFWSLFYQSTFAQKISELSKEQHLVINSIIKYSTEESIKVYIKTISYEPWMDLIKKKEFETLEIIGDCTSDILEFEQAIKSFKNLILGLEIKMLDPNELDSRFKLIKNPRRKNILFISEPILIGNYSFQFLKSINNKVLHVQKKNSIESWEYGCGIFLSATLH